MRVPLNDLSGRRFDVAVVGAGINGCAAAQELAGGGYSVLLVDKGDFGAGSTSRSTRLLHCGLRFLAPAGLRINGLSIRASCWRQYRLRRLRCERARSLFRTRLVECAG